MTLDYVSVDDAVRRPGLRMVVVGGVPSGWSEAAKGILHIKRIEWAAVRLTYDSELLKQWAGQRSGPVAIHDDEPPLAGWREILMLAERLAPSPALVPADPLSRDLVLELSNDICGKGGLGWARRLQLVHLGLHGEGGFPERVAAYLGKKYGYSPEAGAAAGARVTELLARLASRLKAQGAAGSDFYVGQQLTAVDIYSAAFMAMFRPLPHDQCPMDPVTRVAFETLDARTAAALDPLLIAHRDRMYAEHLELPLSL
jgi:glutathione S-transferase